MRLVANRRIGESHFDQNWSDASPVISLQFNNAVLDSAAAGERFFELSCGALQVDTLIKP